MLAALTNALSNLLADRNGMAVVATHSPVVLQEVPTSCVHALERHGDELTARRPDLKTYGESVGELRRAESGGDLRMHHLRGRQAGADRPPRPEEPLSSPGAHTLESCACLRTLQPGQG
ncbi:hypothetical protein [Streptomyces polychromogenes]|uniref:hypothetical protein n=1 Tax=Streptomyces polychromogenes TaxID=67342 RepID=UPI003CD059F2